MEHYVYTRIAAEVEENQHRLKILVDELQQVLASQDFIRNLLVQAQKEDSHRGQQFFGVLQGILTNPK